jgi:hypothetical protein
MRGLQGFGQSGGYRDQRRGQGLQSGDTQLGANPTGLIKSSVDGVNFDDGATEDDPVVGSVSWTWTLTGSR